MNKQHSKYTFKGHGNAITSLAFSSDGKRLVSSGYDERTILWEVETAKVLNVLPFGWREQGRLSPDASRIATAKGVWDIASGEVIRRHRKLGILACSPDGRLLVSCEHIRAPETYYETLKEITIFDSQTGRKKHRIEMDSTLSPLGSGENSYLFSPDGEYLAFLATECNPAGVQHLDHRTTSSNKTIYLYELGARSLIAQSSSSSYHQLYWMHSPAADRLVATNYIGSRLWDAETGDLLQEFPSYDYPFLYMISTLSPDGRLLARATREGRVEVYSVLTSQLLWRQDSHQGWVRALAFTSDSRKLASAGDDHAILIHDAETGERLHNLMGRIPYVEAVSFMQDGKHVTALYDDDSARLWDIEIRRLERQEGASQVNDERFERKTPQMARHYWNPALEELNSALQRSPVFSVQAISPDGTLVALINRGYAFLRSFQPDTKETAATNLEPPPAPLEEILYNHLLNTRGKRLMAIWHTESRSVHHSFSIPETLDCVLFPDNRHCAVAHEKQVVIYSLETGEALQRFDMEGSYSITLTLSPDGYLLAAALFPFDPLLIWDLRTGKQIGAKRIRADDGLDVAFFPDGDRIITSWPHSKYAIIWRLSRNSKTFYLEGHTGDIQSVACSPDGKLVATGAQDGAVKVWDATSGALLATYQALPEAEAWVVHTPEGEVTGSPGAEAYLMENIERER